MRKLMLVAAVAAALIAPSSAQAWNARGHMMVAAVAWPQLTPNARATISRLLKKNPDYNDWIAGVPAELVDQVAFMQAATWPDDIRDSYQDDGYDPTVPQAGDNRGYADRWVHAYWHFKNIAFSTDGTPFPPPAQVNAIERIKLFRDTLNTPADDDVESYDLVWLTHLVGDMHQPLHATSRYSKTKKAGDNGGNGVFVCASGPCTGGQKLHSFWDYGVGASQDYRSVIAHAERLPAAPADKRAITEPDTWLKESYKLARSRAYIAPIGGGKGPYVLTPAYKQGVGSTAEQQVALAGARLADLLNDRFK